MTTWGKICRICSSPADYELFAKIPTYLHETANELLNWPKPINVMIEETTGLKVQPTDGLPNTICALCISYMKHAVTFRDQTITNTLSLMAVDSLRQKAKSTRIQSKHEDKDKDKDSMLITEQELSYVDGRQTDTNLLMNNAQPDQNKVCKQLLNDNSQLPIPMQKNVEQQIHYLNTLFQKKNSNARHIKSKKEKLKIADCEHVSGDKQSHASSSSEDNEDTDAAPQNLSIFSYDEKNFEEDDIMEELRNSVQITIPESCKERKCRACFRRFMFEDSFTEHVGVCIEYKFLTLIEESNRLLDIRRNRAISPHEFIRRMIFCLRKTSVWLTVNYGDLLLPELLKTTEPPVKHSLESEGKSSATSAGEQKAELSSGEKLVSALERCKYKYIYKSVESLDQSQEKLEMKFPTVRETLSSLNTNLMNFFNAKLTNQSKSKSPITASNNILLEIERSQSRNSNPPVNILTDPAPKPYKPIIKLPKPILQLPEPVVQIPSCQSIDISDARATAGFSPDPNRDSKFNYNNENEASTFRSKKQRRRGRGRGRRRHSELIPLTPVTPKLNVRRDLFPAQNPEDKLFSAPNEPAMPTPLISKMSLSARCNLCSIVFENVDALEMHNAAYHNGIVTPQKQRLQSATLATLTTPESVAAPATPQPFLLTPISDCEYEKARRRIISLFEGDSDIEY